MRNVHHAGGTTERIHHDRNKKRTRPLANGYEEITGSMLPADLRANLKRALLAGVYGFEYDPGIMTRAILAYGYRTGFLTGLVHSTRIMSLNIQRISGVV